TRRHGPLSAESDGAAEAPDLSRHEAAVGRSPGAGVARRHACVVRRQADLHRGRSLGEASAAHRRRQAGMGMLSRLALLGLMVTLAALPSRAQAPETPPQWMSPEGGKVNGSTAEIEAGPCCGPSRGNVRSPDDSIIFKLKGAASRDGDVLRL